MRTMLDIRFLWVAGAANLLFTIVGLSLAASMVGVPLFLAVAATGGEQEAALKWLAYTAPFWAPVGAGAGLITAGLLARGIRRKPPDPAAGRNRPEPTAETV
jgi:hypothetical protein